MIIMSFSKLLHLIEDSRVKCVCEPEFHKIICNNLRFDDENKIKQKKKRSVSNNKSNVHFILHAGNI